MAAQPAAAALFRSFAVVAVRIQDALRFAGLPASLLQQVVCGLVDVLATC